MRVKNISTTMLVLLILAVFLCGCDGPYNLPQFDEDVLENIFDDTAPLMDEDMWEDVLDDAAELIDDISSDTSAYLQPPFRDDLDKWYMTQSFGAYYDLMDGQHYGEDWNREPRGGKKDEVGENVYPIAPGKVIKCGEAGSLGGYIVIKHEGRFSIPASSGPHLMAAGYTTNEAGRGSNNCGAIIYADDVFCNGEMIDNDFGDEPDYTYVGMTVFTIYSVYLHVDPLAREGDKITSDNIDMPIARIANIPESHLHLEIRIAEPARWTPFPYYFKDSQDMIDAGYREPSSIIQANMGGSQCNAGIIQPEKPEDEQQVEAVEEAIIVPEFDFSALVGTMWIEKEAAESGGYGEVCVFKDSGDYMSLKICQTDETDIMTVRKIYKCNKETGSVSGDDGAVVSLEYMGNEVILNYKDKSTKVFVPLA